MGKLNISSEVIKIVLGVACVDAFRRMAKYFSYDIRSVLGGATDVCILKKRCQMFVYAGCGLEVIWCI